MEEKSYEFTVSRDGSKQPQTVIIKESELEPKHINLLAGSFIRDYNDLPTLVKELIKSTINS